MISLYQRFFEPSKISMDDFPAYVFGVNDGNFEGYCVVEQLFFAAFEIDLLVDDKYEKVIIIRGCPYH